MNSELHTCLLETTNVMLLKLLVNQFLYQNKFSEEDEKVLVEIIKKDNQNQSILEIIILWAIEKDRIEYVKNILDVSHFDPCFDDYKVVIKSMEKYRKEISILLLNDTRIFGCHHLIPNVFFLVIDKNWIEIIELLLKNPLVDPNINFERMYYPKNALEYAIQLKRIEIIKLFLQDPRVDPNINDCHAIVVAFELHDREILRLLTPHPKIDTNFLNGWLQTNIVKKRGYDTKLIEDFLKDPRVVPNDEIIEYIFRNLWNYEEIIPFILPKINPEKIKNCKSVGIIKNICDQISDKSLDSVKKISETMTQHDITVINITDKTAVISFGCKQLNRDVLHSIIDSMQKDNITRINVTDDEIHLTLKK